MPHSLSGIAPNGLFMEGYERGNSQGMPDLLISGIGVFGVVIVCLLLWFWWYHKSRKQKLK
jgi:hypothetical protein